MKITWENIIDLIERMFEVNQSAIADRLRIDRSVISRLKSGKQLSLRKTSHEIFQVIFDPQAENSFAYGMSPQDLLENLKAVVKELDLVALTKDLRDDDYREFVQELLRSVKKNKPDNSSPINDFSTEEAKTEENDQEADATQDCIQDDIPVEKEGSTVDLTKILKDDCGNDFETVSLYSDRENKPDNSSPINDFSTEEAKTEENDQEADATQDCIQDDIPVEKEGSTVDLTKILKDDCGNDFETVSLYSDRENESGSSSPTNDFSTEEAKTEENDQEADATQDCIQDDIPVEKEGSTVDLTKILKDDCGNDFETVSLYSDRENESGSSSPTNDFSTEEAKTEENDQEADATQDCIQDDIPVETGKNAIQECMHYENECAQLTIPKSCKICLCCDNWKGNVSNAYKSSRGVEGKCIMYNKNTLSVDGRSCERFCPNYGRITQYNFLQPMLEFKKWLK